MNGIKTSAVILRDIAARYDAALQEAVELMICPPATLLMAFAEMTKLDAITIGAQDCHAEPKGAYTGDISAGMIADLGAKAVIVGHSERRQHHGEDDLLVRTKAEAANQNGLISIICVGETKEQREAGDALSIISQQIDTSLPDQAKADTLIIAYEPVWAIGTGLTPNVDDVTEMHKHIRSKIVKRYGRDGNKIRILYGGSVKPDNAVQLMAVENVNGALVGGASLQADDFLNIARAYLSL